MNSKPANPTKTKPLSAYNLFFQYHRIKLLQLSSAQAPAPAASADVDSSSLPGLEDVDSNSSLLSATEQEIRRHRKQTIERTLDDSPFNAKDKQRSHKRTHGSMTFLEMSSYMSKKWKDADANTKSIFRQISNERKARHQKLEFDLYKARSQKFALNTSSSTTDTIAPPRVVSLDSVTSASGAGSVFKTNQVSSDISLSNASWGHTLSSRNQNQQTKNPIESKVFHTNEFTPSYLPNNNIAMSNINWNNLSLTLPSQNANTAQGTSANQCVISVDSVTSSSSSSSSSVQAHNGQPLSIMVQSQNTNSAFKTEDLMKIDSDSLSFSPPVYGQNDVNYASAPHGHSNNKSTMPSSNWEVPLPLSAKNEEKKTKSIMYKAEELSDRPLSLIGKDEKMSNKELQYWLSKLDWDKE